MNEQLSMFSDPLREMALKTIRSAIKSIDDIDRVFESYYGGSREGYDFCFDPYQGERDRNENGEIY